MGNRDRPALLGMDPVMKTPDNRLSLAASAVWRMRTAEQDPYGDPSGDLGDSIAAYHRGVELQKIEDAGYRTPGEYNDDLRSRMIGPDGKVTCRVNELLLMLEIEDVCRCGTALETTRHRTRNYGGGWDTFVKCPSCSYAEVYV